MKTVSISVLARLPQLRVVPTSVLQRYRGQAVVPQTVASELGVRALLTGSVLRRADALIVRADLMDGQESSLIWGQRYSRELNDIFAVEEDIAQQVAEALRLQLTDEESGRLAKGGTKNSEAYQAFLRGWYHQGRFSVEGQQALQGAIRYYEQAVALDPTYQDSYEALGWIYFHLARTDTASEENYTRARESWEHLIEADDTTPLAHATKARILWQYERRWEEAEAAYRRATELGQDLGTDWWWFQEWMGRREDYLESIERALQEADPLSSEQQGWLGWAFLWGREYDRAIEQANKTLALEPQAFDPYSTLSACYQLKGMEQEAFDARVAMADRYVRSHGKDMNVTDLETVRERFDTSGLKGVQQWQLERSLQQPVKSPRNIATMYAQLGQKDQAFEWLEKLWELPLWGFEAAPSNPLLDPLRDDPRFEQFLRKLDLSEKAIQRHLAAG